MKHKVEMYFPCSNIAFRRLLIVSPETLVPVVESTAEHHRSVDVLQGVDKYLPGEVREVLGPAVCPPHLDPLETCAAAQPSSEQSHSLGTLRLLLKHGSWDILGQTQLVN